MAITRTRAELIDAVLEELQALATGQAAAPEDAALVNKYVDTTLATLAAQGLVYVPDADAINDAVFQQVVVFVADTVKGKFGVAVLPDNAVEKAEAALRKISGGKSTGSALKAEYF